MNVSPFVVYCVPLYSGQIIAEGGTDGEVATEEELAVLVEDRIIPLMPDEVLAPVVKMKVDIVMLAALLELLEDGEEV